MNYIHAYEVQYKLHTDQCKRNWKLFEENKELREIVAWQVAALEAGGGDMSISIDYQAKYNEKCDELATRDAHVDGWKRQIDTANERLNVKCLELAALRGKGAIDWKKQFHDLSECFDDTVQGHVRDLRILRDNSRLSAGPVPTSGEILRMYTEAARDPKCHGTQHLWEAYQMAIAREKTTAKVEDFMGKEGAEKLAEQVVALVKEKLTEKERLAEKAYHAPAQLSWPYLEAEYLDEPVKIPTAQLKPGNIYLDAHWQVCIYVPNCTELDCYWYNGEGHVQAANQAPGVVSHIGQLKTVYHTHQTSQEKESK